MVQYRRNWVLGGSYFFTVTLRNRKSTALVDHVDALRAAFRHVHHQRPFVIKDGVKLARNAKGGYELWQRRYWEHTLRDEIDLTRHVDYIHFNPVKHGYVASATEWSFSSFHRYVKAGICTANWGSSPMNFDGIGHE